MPAVTHYISSMPGYTGAVTRSMAVIRAPLIRLFHRPRRLSQRRKQEIVLAYLDISIGVWDELPAALARRLEPVGDEIMVATQRLVRATSQSKTSNVRWHKLSRALDALLQEVRAIMEAWLQERRAESPEIEIKHEPEYELVTIQQQSTREVAARVALAAQGIFIKREVQA